MTAEEKEQKDKDKKNKDESFKEKIGSLENKINSLQDEIDKLKEEVKEKDDKLLRSYADLQNYQKRMKKDLKAKEKEVKQKYIAEIIDLHELLKKAYEDKNPKEGLKHILNNINDFFEKESVECIDCVGKKFDHNLHNAVATVEKEDCEDGIIMEEVKKGFKIDDEPCRPSHVVVAKNVDKDKDKKENN
ncbi:MAG: nucleotide exchange factor GrpE [Candidatus Thermoplasmatota archaeon]